MLINFLHKLSTKMLEESFNSRSIHINTEYFEVCLLIVIASSYHYGIFFVPGA